MISFRNALCACALVLVAASTGRAQSSRAHIWSVVTRGSGGVIEQSSQKRHAGPGPLTWRFVLRPQRVGWYRVSAYARSGSAVTARLTTAGRLLSGAQQIANDQDRVTEWLFCTSPANRPIVLEVRASGPAEWAFAMWEPPTSIPLPPCR